MIWTTQAQNTCFQLKVFVHQTRFVSLIGISGTDPGQWFSTFRDVSILSENQRGAFLKPNYRSF